MTRTLRIGTRGSQLALVQARWVAARLAEHGVPTELDIIRTEGDDRPVDTAWGEGAFVGRIVAALLEGRVDLAVHSAKDVPTDEHPDLVIAAYPPREDPRDALVCRERGTTLATLPAGARVGTDSPRRVAFLGAARPDLVIHPLHGNVDTRLAKLDRGDADALVLAVAGLTRLGRADRIDDILPTALVSSAPGQGSLALQVRADDPEAISAVGLLDDPATRAAVVAERALLNGTGGGCRSPIGALGRVLEDGRLEVAAAAERTWHPATGAPFAGVVARVVRVRGTAAPAANRELAARLAARIVALRARPRVLVLRPDAQAHALLAGLDAAGAEAVAVPAIEIRAAEPGGDLDAALRAIPAGGLAVVTSASAVAALDEAAARTGVSLGTLRWAAVGTATASALAAAGATDVFVPSEPNADALARELPLRAGEPVLLAQGDLAGATLAEVLRARGASVTEAVAYRTLEAPTASVARLAAALDEGPIDAVVVTSGSTARGLAALAATLGTGALAALRTAPVVAIGEPSAGAARAAGFGTVLVAPTPEPGPLAAFVARALGIAPHDAAVAAAGPGTTDTPPPSPTPVPATAGGAR